MEQKRQLTTPSISSDHLSLQGSRPLVDCDLTALLADRARLHDLYQRKEDYQHILSNLGGYFEDPEKGNLYKQLKRLMKEKKMSREEKELVEWISHGKLTIGQMKTCAHLYHPRMESYELLWEIAFPEWIDQITKQVEKYNPTYGQVAAQMKASLVVSQPRSFKDLLLEIEDYCMVHGLVLATSTGENYLEQIEIELKPVMKALSTDNKMTTKGILEIMEPLVAAQLEVEVMDRMLKFGEHLEKYEQGVVTGKMENFQGLINAGWLDQELNGVDEKAFLDFLSALYDNSKRTVVLPGTAGEGWQLAITNKSFSKSSVEESFGELDQTLPRASMEIDLDKTDAHILGLLCYFLPDKFEYAGEVIFLKGKKYEFVDQISGQKREGYPSIRPLSDGTDRVVDLYEESDGILKEKSPLTTISSSDGKKYYQQIVGTLGTITLEDKELIVLQDIYLACAHANALVSGRQKTDEELSIDENKIEHVVGPSDKTTESKDNRLEKGEVYVFSHYTDQVPVALAQQLKVEGKWKEPHGPYAWIEKGKVYYNTLWIKEKFGIEISLNPHAILPLEAYLYNGKTLDDLDLDISTSEFRAFFAWKEQQKRHEILHRILGFRQIEQLEVMADDGESYVLTQEQLCRFAEQEQINREDTIEHPELPGKIFSWEVLEQAIAQALGREQFSFSAIPQVDLDDLEKYITHGDEAFLDQLAANAAAGVAVQPGQFSTPVETTNFLHDHATNAPKAITKNKSITTPVRIGPHTYMHQTTTPSAGGAPTGEWIETFHNPTNPKAPYQKVVTEADIQEQVDQLNSGAFLPVSSTPTLPSGTTPLSGVPGASSSNPAVNTANTMTLQQTIDQFKNDFETAIEGDVNARFDSNTVLYFRLEDSVLPGYGGTWVYADIVRIDEAAGRFTIRLQGSTEGMMGSATGKEITYDMDKQGLNRLLQKGDVKKFVRKSTGKEFYDYITQGLITTGSFKAAKEARSGQQVFWEDGQMIQKKYYNESTPQKDVVAHVGRIDTHNPKNTVLYDVSWGDGGVTVSSDGWSKKMDYTTFLIFLLDKNLSPYSKEQAENVQREKKSYEDSQRPPINWTSIAALGLAFKKIGPLFKNAFNMEERQKIQAARMTYSISKLFGGGLSMEALNNLDESIYSVIGKFQSSLGGRESKDAGDVHAEAVSRRIEKEIFQTGFSFDPGMFKLKAAGYLLYALDKGGHPYFRALNPYAHQGMRVKAILGPQHHAVFMEERRKFIDQVKSGGLDDKIMFDKLIKFELNYIHTTIDKEQMVKVFGSQFPKKVEGYKDKFGSGDAIDPIKNSMAVKNNFDDYANTFRATLVKHTPAVAMAALELMVENADTEAQYNEVYMSIVQLFVSGLGTWTFGQDHKDRLVKIGRMAGIPLALMANDINAPHKVLAMVDYISRQAGISSLSGKLGKYRSRDGLAFTNLTVNEEHKKVMGSVKEWWETGRNGSTVIDAFNYSNMHLLSYEKNASSEEKGIIDEYFEKRVFNELADTRFGYSEKLTLAGDSPFYSKGILNISPATFSKVMESMDRNTGQFREPGAREMWIQFKNIMQTMNTQLSNSSGPAKEFLLKLILKKFALYMGPKFTSEELRDIKEGLVGGNNIKQIETYLKNSYSDRDMWKVQELINQQDQLEKKKVRKRGKSAANAVVDNGLDALTSLLEAHGHDITKEIVRFAFP